MQEYILSLPDEAATLSIGATCAMACDRASKIYIYGDIGTGKTTFCRSFIQTLGHKGKIKSPTYKLVEPYVIHPLTVYHFDLYRLNDPVELECIGIRDYFTQNAICLIEWAHKGYGVLPEADLALHLSSYKHERTAKIQACSSYGQQFLECIHRQ